MRKGFIGLLVGLTVSIAASAAVAKPVIYDCKNSSNRKQSVIQANVVISYDAAKEQVFVSDPLIVDLNGGPIAGKMKSDNDIRTVFTWSVKNVVNSEGKSATLNFRGSYFKADGTFLLSMKPLGYDNSFEDRGTCKLK